MNRRDIVVGLVILLAIVGVVYVRNRSMSKEAGMKIPQTLSVEDVIEEKFNVQIPENLDKAELTDVSGGSASAIATREYVGGKFVLTILADLPELGVGSYSAQLVLGEQTLNAGELIIAKGGYLLEYESVQDLTGYNQVRVLTDDKTILEGSF